MSNRTVYQASNWKWYFHDRGLKGGPFRWRWIAALNLFFARAKL